MDDAERKRRKIGSEEGGREGDDDGADEEEKIERFFALIQSTKAVLQSVGRESRERARLDEEERARKAAAVWTPTFRPEDFKEDYKSLRSSFSGVQPGPSDTKAEEDEKAEREKQKEDNDLDLKLSL